MHLDPLVVNVMNRAVQLSRSRRWCRCKNAGEHPEQRFCGAESGGDMLLVAEMLVAAVPILVSSTRNPTQDVESHLVPLLHLGDYVCS